MKLTLSLPTLAFFVSTALLACLAFTNKADAQLLHLWDFEGENLTTILADKAGSLDLNLAPGEGNVGGVMGDGTDVAFVPGFQFSRAYRPYYVDASQSSTAGAGITGSGFTSPNQFTIEAIVKANQKTSNSAVNYLFQTRPGSDRGYYLVQDEDNVPVGTTSGLGSIIGSNFSDAGIPVGYSDDGHWIYIAAVIDLTSNAGQAVADIYAADLSAGETMPTLILNNRTWNTANPSGLAGATGIFGIGNFAVDRNGDTFAEASQEWFQGDIDHVAIYNGLLGQQDLADNLRGHLEHVPEPSTVVLTVLAGLTLWSTCRRR